MIPLLFGLLFALQNPTPTPTPTPAQTPPAEKTPPAAEPPVQEKVPWTAKDLPAVLKDAKADSKLVLLYFRQDGDAEAELVSQHVLSSDEVAELLKDVICMKIDVKKQPQIASQYNVTFTPIFAWLNPDGTPRDRFSTFKEVRFFAAAISRIKVDAGTINELRKKVAADGNDLESRYELYRRLKEFGDIQGSSEQKSAILKLDTAGTSRGSHHFAYDRITSDIERYWSSNGKLPEAKIA